MASWNEKWNEAGVVVVEQPGLPPVAVGFPEYHDVRPVSFSCDI